MKTKHITITYCKPCGYEPRAANAAAALKKELGLTADLISGKGGIFQVAIDGAVVAKKSGRGFPGDAEIVAAVSQALGH
jgi:selenoprotein W-related protein